MNNIKIIKKFAIVNLLNGIFLLFFGIFVEPTIPASLLDQVLSPNELAEETIRQNTHKILVKSNGNRWIFWDVCGIVCSCSSIVILVKSKVINNSRVDE